MNSPIRRLVPWILLCAILVPVTGAQQEPSSIFIDRVDVNVINVEVFVTDRQGRRVAGLSAEDFEIYEDGRQVEISNFYAVAREDRVGSNLDRDRAMLAGDRPLERRRPLPEDQRLNLLVYVDNFNLRPASRNKVLKEMSGFLEDRMAQGDNVMMVSYNRSFQVVQPFTRDPEEVRRAVQKLKKASGYRQIDELNRREVIRNMNEAVEMAPDLDDAFYMAQGFVETYIHEAQLNLRTSARALQSVTRSLAGLPGRKAILYVSDGLPQRPGEELYEHLANLFPRGAQTSFGQRVSTPIDSFDEDEAPLFNTITRDANAHQVTLYTLDARGSTGTSMLSAEHESLGPSGGGLVGVDSIRNFNLQSPLIDLATNTGGSAIVNTLNFGDAFERMATDFDSFYSLGYRSPRGGDGKFHKIRVEVKRPGLEVRHRSGYLDKPEVERVADRTFSSLILELEKNPLGVGVDFGPPEKKSRGQYILPVIIRIPVRDLTLLPQGEVEQGRLSIFLVISDGEGGISKLHQIPLPVSFPRDKVASVRGSEIGYRTNLQIRRGTPKIAVGVWDELSGVESFVHKRVLVGDEKKKRDNVGP